MCVWVSARVLVAGPVPLTCNIEILNQFELMFISSPTWPHSVLKSLKSDSINVSPTAYFCIHFLLADAADPKISCFNVT
jgi:hypothetical protein